MCSYLQLYNLSHGRTTIFAFRHQLHRITGLPTIPAQTHRPRADQEQTHATTQLPSPAHPRARHPPRFPRLLEDCEANPLYGKLNTVGELVDFFVYQPRRRLLEHQTSLAELGE